MTKKLIGVLTLVFSCVSCAAVDPQTKVQQSHNPKNLSSTAGQLSESFTWIDGGKKRTAWFDNEHVVEIGVNPKSNTNTRSLKESNIKKAGFSQSNQSGDMVFWKRASTEVKNRSNIKALQASEGLLPVYRSNSSSDSGYLIPVGGVLVQMEDGKMDALKNWAKQNNKKLTAVAGGVAWLLESTPGEAAIELATEVSKLQGIKTASPNWRLPISMR